jgi:peptidoglycan/xylan/chitin deacetylase (PgdA/CDA1 family)
MPVIGYHAHTVAEGETLAAIAVNGGSDAALIQAYNQLEGPPTPGCPLIVPHLQGQINVLPEEPLLVVQGCTTQPIVALTLDAGGGSEPTAAMLDALRERNIRITFFLTGDWIAENPDLVRQIVADGHEVANHSRTHADFTTLDKAQMIEELAETERLFRETTGVERMRPFFRPPYGAYDRDVLLTVIEQGYMPIYWTLDSLDSYGEPKTPQFLLERVTTTLAPDELRGAIILAHCGSEATAEALPDILDRLTEMGFDVRPLSDVV